MQSAEILMLAAIFLEPQTLHVAHTMKPITISVACDRNITCEFYGEDIRLKIQIKNTSGATLGIPLEYIKKRGPHVQLTDIKTGNNRWLRVSLAPRVLREKYVFVGPDETVEISTLLSAREIRVFREHFVDLDVEVAIISKVKPENGDPIDISESHTFKITGRDTEELEKTNR